MRQPLMQAQEKQIAENRRACVIVSLQVVFYLTVIAIGLIALAMAVKVFVQG